MLKIVNGKSESDKKKLYEKMKEIFAEGGNFEVIIKKFYRKKTEKQVRYYHFLVGFVAQAVGEDPATIHNIVKYKFLSISNEFHGETYTTLRSTKELNVKEMGELIDKFIAWVNVDLNLTLPGENELPIDYDIYKEPDQTICKSDPPPS